MSYKIIRLRGKRVAVWLLHHFIISLSGRLLVR